MEKKQKESKFNNLHHDMLPLKAYHVPYDMSKKKAKKTNYIELCKTK